MRAALPAALALALAACAPKPVYLRPSSAADGMVYYHEQDRLGDKHAISSEELDESGREPTRVPAPALIDIDSTLHLGIRPGGAAPDGEAPAAGGDELVAQKQALTDLMLKLDQLQGLTQKAVEAYLAKEEVLADLRIKEQAKKRIEFLDALEQRYPVNTETGDAVQAEIGVRGLEGVRPFLQVELDTIEARDDELRALAESRSSTLRIEAFLARDDANPVAVHVPGYDSLPEGKLVTRDRVGLDLSEDERAELVKQVEATSALAKTLETVRTKEKSIFEGVKEALDNVSPELAAKVREGEQLALSLTDEARLERVKSGFKSAAERAADDADALSESIRAQIRALPDALIASLKEDVGGVEAVLLLVAEGKALQDRWERLVESQDMSATLDLILATRTFAGDVSKAFESVPKWIRDAAKHTGEFLELEAAGISDEVVTAFENYLKSDEVTDLTKEVHLYYADVKRAAKLVKETLAVLDVGKLPVEGRVAPTVPEAFDVAFDELKDTSIDLGRVPSADGDILLVRTTLKQPGLDPQQSNAEFKITHYGWHARISPSVVLVRPDEVASGDDEYRFAPALGWMHHYRPRPEDSGFFADALRPLQPALGIHAIFLNFENETGIGLGGTLSFWNDRLQAGAGYNLSASSSDEGQVYYFIGSDLIGLLQTVGIGDNR